MTCRPLSIVAALSVVLLTYSVLVGVMLARINSWISCSYWRIKPVSPPRFAGGYVWLFGTWVPLWLLISIASIAPALWIVVEVLRRVRRHNRERLGQCFDCGQPLPARRGRCPRCGLRYELVYYHGEPLFPVIRRRDWHGAPGRLQ